MEPTTTALALTFASTALKVLRVAKAESEGEALEKLLGLRAEFAKLMPDSNDEKANKEFAKQLQEMVLAQEEWKNHKESEKPRPEDVLHGYEQLKAASAATRSNKKRKVLFNAFWNSFKPEFYAEGVCEILWAKVEALEYPDFIFLKKVLDSTDPKKSNGWFFESVQEGGRGKWRGNQLPVFHSDEDAEYAERLSHQGLADLEPSETQGILLVSWKGLAPKLKIFALDEFFENYEPEQSALTTEPIQEPNKDDDQGGE